MHFARFCFTLIIPYKLEARIRLQNIAEGQVSSKFLNMMKDSLPRKSQMKLKGERGSGMRCRATLLYIVNVRVRVQLIRHSKTCMTEIHLHNECAHVGLSIHAPVCQVSWVSTVFSTSRLEGRSSVWFGIRVRVQ